MKPILDQIYFTLILVYRNRYISICIMTAGVRIPPAGARDLSPLHSIETGSEAPPSLVSSGYSVFFFPHVKLPEREADHSPPSNAEVKNGGAITPHMSSSLGV
jgi:hypothetical protein